ncbi:protein FAM32A-like [Hibiscus syriacus]|uniref:protein FAM32A-like n=1 Tax=Hibiscus syriacus TaxID=106335 RepID=UPI0019234E78|nr:protein FAM32A-like [Hibiscus syriacus]
MSAYQNIVGGRLSLKEKPLEVVKAKAEVDVISKKKRNKHKHRYASHSQCCGNYEFFFCFPSKLVAKGENKILSIDSTNNHGEPNAFEDHLTSAERKFLQQTRQLELQRLEKMATKSHHDRILEFNQYLANLT